MGIEIDNDLHYKARDERCQPVILVPDIDFSKLKDDSIIDSF